MTIYCSQCGKANASDATQCASCGTVLRAPSDAPKRFKGTMILGNPYQPTPKSAPSSPSAAAKEFASKTLFGNPTTPSPASTSSRPTDPLRPSAKRTLIAGSGVGTPSFIPQGLFSDADPLRPQTHATDTSADATRRVDMSSSPPSGTVRIGSMQAHETFSAIKSARPIAAPKSARQSSSQYFGRLGVWSVIVGVLSFVPVYGIPFAMLAVIWGWITWRQGGLTLALLGTIGFFVGLLIMFSAGMQFLRLWFGVP